MTPGVIFDKLSNSLPSEAPQFGQLANPVVLLESGVLNGHGTFVRVSLLPPAPLLCVERPERIAPSARVEPPLSAQPHR
jgi:hypothetical protein